MCIRDSYRMNDIQAALGLNQLKRLDKFVKQRHEIADYYNVKLKSLPLTTPWQSPNVYSSYHLYPILIKPNYILQLQIILNMTDTLKNMSEKNVMNSLNP